MNLIVFRFFYGNLLSLQVKYFIYFVRKYVMWNMIMVSDGSLLIFNGMYLAYIHHFFF